MVKGTKKLFGFITACLLATLMAVTAIVTLISPKQVFAVDAAGTGSYVKVTEAPADWSGDYLIVYETDGVIFDGSLTTLDKGNNIQKVTIENNTIIGDYSAYTFTIAEGYTIKSKSGYYIGQTKNDNGLKSNTSTTYTNTLSLNNDGTVNIVSGGAYLRFNSSSGDNNYRFRYYKSSTYTNQKAICLYKYVEATGGDEELSPIETALNEVNAYMSLAYKYTATSKTVASSEVDDILDIAVTGVTSGSNTYKDWTYEASKTSGAKYVGQSAGGNNAIQIRSKNNNSGVVTTKSGGVIKKISVKFATSGDKELNIYGKNEAYTAATELYDESVQGKLLGTITSSATELNIDGDYTYIGFRSAEGAMYLSKVEITWDSGESGTKTETVLENSEFRIRCGVDASLLAIADVEELGIRVTAKNGKTKEYTNKAGSWTVEGEYVYVIVSLGDIVNDVEKLTTEFTVQAYVTAGDITYVSELSKTYSVANMVKEYKEEKGLGVDHLYNYLLGKGIIEEGA